MNHSISPGQSKLKRFLSNTAVLLSRVKSAVLSMSTLVIVCGILLLSALFAAAITPVRYNLSIGMVPTHTITANRDVIDEVTTESHRIAAEDAVQPTYKYVDGVTENVLSDFDQIFQQFDNALEYAESLADYNSAVRRFNEEELEQARSIITLITLRDYQLQTLLAASRSDLAALYNILYAAIENTMSSYVIEGAEYSAVSNIMQMVGYRADTNLLQNVILPTLNHVVQANLVIDQEATDIARQQARENVEPVVYKQGQNIVVKGEGRIERYQYEMLSSLGLLSDASINISIYLGAVLLVVMILGVSLILLNFISPEIIRDPKRLILLFVILVLTLASGILARVFNIYLAPIVLAALLLSSMLGLQSAVLFNVSMSLLISALAAGGSTGYTAEMVQLLASSLCSGAVGAMIIHRHTSRLRIIGAGIAAGICNFIMVLALGLMTSSAQSVLINALWVLAGGAIAGVLSIAMQPLLEAAFNLPTPMKLMELSNPNHPLLRRLLLEAPGTYHHSIVVANLAEAAAEAIGANPLLARVGGYYHDVGKLRRPLYFKENQLGEENKLVETDPYTAAQIVISHTRDGVALARHYHLPREILRIIQEHHGNTPVMYFYSAAVKEANGKPVNDADFRYDANPPSTKEGAIVMLCDTIEAAVRSMQAPTPEAIEEFIIKLIRGKLQDGQLSNSPLTLKDIDDICHASATVLNGVFHERIEYPDPPAEISHPAEKADAPSPAPDGEELSKPWDGVSQEESEQPDEDETSSDLPVASFVAPPPPPPSGKQILIDPSEFEPEAPLPVVAPPSPEALPSVDEVLETMGQEKAVSDTEEATPAPEQELPQDPPKDDELT